MAINWKQVRTAAKRQDQQQIRGRTAAGVSAPQAQTQISEQGRIDWDAVKGNAQLLDKQQAQSRQRENAYEEAYQQYKQIADSVNHDQLSGYLRTMQERQNQIIDSINHDQMSGYRRTLQEKERQQQRKVQTGTAAQQAATNAGQDYSRLIGLNQFDGELERRAAEWQRKRQAAQEAAALDQERGRRRTSEEYGKRIDALEAASDYARAQNAEGGGLPEFKDAYDKVNAGRETPMTLDEMQKELAYTRYKKAVLDKSVSGRVGEYAGDLATQFISGGADMALGGLGMVLGYLEQGANGAAAWVLRDLAKAVPDGSIKDKMLSLADDFSSYYTGESMTAGEETARYYRDELNRIGDEIEGKYKGVPLWIQQQMPSAGNMLFGAGLSGIAGVNNLVTLGLTSGGNSALEAKDKGASDAQALAYGVVAGGLEVFSERLFGGNPIYDADAGLVNQAVGKLTSNKTIMKILNSKAFDIASEGLEEVVTEVLDPVAEWAIYNGDNTEFADAASIGNAFLGGVFLSAIGNVADAPKQLQQARYERVLRTAGSELADIAQSVDSADVQEAAQVIRDKIAYGVTPDAADIGAVLDAMDQAGETVDVEQVREAVDAEENEAKAAQAEAAFQTYNQYADERDAKARDAEKASWARSQENTEAINDAEADSAADAFEKLNEAEVKGAADARARQQTEEARAERTFTQESREDADRLLTDAARRYGFDDRMTSVLLSGYDGEQDAQQYAEDVNAAYEYGRNGMSLSAAQRAAQGVNADVAQEAWNAGRASIQRAPMSAFERYNQYADERDARQAAREAPQQASVQTVQAVQEAARPQQMPTQTAAQEAREAAQNAQEAAPKAQEAAPKAQETVRETVQEQTRPAQERAETKPAKQEAQESKPQALAENQYDARKLAEAVIKKYKMTVPDAVKDYSKRLDEAVAERYRLAEADGKSEESKATVSSMIASFQIGLRGIGFVSNKTNNADLLADAQAWLIGNAVAKGSYARLDAVKAFAGMGIEERTLRYAAELWFLGDSLTQRMVREYNAQKGKNKGVSAAEYVRHVRDVFDRGALGESLAGTKDRLLGDGMTRAAWNAGKGFINGEEAGSTAADEGGKRDAGMDSGEQAGAVAEGTGGAKTRSAKASAVAERIELENRVRAAGQPYLSGKDIGLEKGSAQRSFREAPESTWTDSMKAAAAMLRREGFKEVHFTVGAISVENQRAKVTRYADGVVTGNTVWINATSKKWTLEQLANHEAFHHQIQDWPYAMDAVRQALADELGEDGIQELAQRYAEAYEGCYDGAELDAYIEEICADAYAGMDRFPEEKAKIIQKAAKTAQDAQQAAEENGGTRGPPEKYSIGEIKGEKKKYGFGVVLDTDIFEGVRQRDWGKTLGTYVYENMAGAELTMFDEDGNPEVVYLARENDRVKKDGAKNSHKVLDKLAGYRGDTIRAKAIVQLDEVLETSRSKETTEDHSHQWLDAHGWIIRNAYLQDESGNIYEATLNIANGKDRKILYEVNRVHQIDKIKSPGEHTVTDNGQRFRYQKPGTGGAQSETKDNINENAANVKEHFSISEDSDGRQLTEAQREFFKDSKAVDEKGRLLTLYHGTGAKFTVFDKGRIEQNFQNRGGDLGFYFSPYIEDAQGYAREAAFSTGGEKAIMEVYLNLKNPLVVEDEGWGSAISQADIRHGDLKRWAQEGGNDGIIVKSTDEVDDDGTPDAVYIAFSPEQIKSVTNKNPTGNPDIRYSVAEDAQEATEGAAELQVEKLPQTNRDQFMRFATKITDDLVTPLTAQMETLRKEMRPRVLELVDEFLENDALKRSSVEAVFTEAYDRALELNQEFSEKYAALQYAIRKTPVTFTEEDTRQIEQYDYFDEAALRKLTIKEKGGVSIGELYSDLSGMLPELFPSGIKNPAKQIMRIASVYKRVSKAQALAQQVESTNPEYFRQNAYNDFLEQLRKIVPKMRTERELAQISIEEEAAMEKAAAERERRLAEEDARLAAEEAAKEPPTVYESLTMDSIPKKAQDYLRRVRGQTAAAIQQTLSMPFAARQEVLKPAIEEMMNEYLQTGRISQETVDRNFEESYRRGMEMDTEFYGQYKDVKTRLRDLKVTLSEADRADIADFDDFRRAASGRLRIANEGGLPVDVAYKEMQQMAPELFPASVTHPADQLMKMFDVSKRIEKVQRSLDEYHGEDAEEFKRWAKNDYEASVENMLGALNVARRYAEARMRQQQARAVPTTMEEVKNLYADLKGLRRTYERAAAKNLLTAEDNSVLNRLLRGEITPEDVQGMENAQGILAMYEAKADYDAAAAKIADWRRYRKGKLREQADNLLKNAEKAKDKKAGIEYSRETMTRNVRDIFPEADAEAINKTYFEPVRTASANANKLKNKLREQVKALDLSRKARKGDAVSEAHAVQLLGEAQDNIRYLEQHPRAQDRDGKTLNEWRQIVLDLWATSPGLDRAKIENAVETFRKIYDGLFEQMNDVRIRNGYEPINYRQGYFPHFQPGTTDGILGLMGKALGIDAEVSALPTTISGLTHTFKPGITYFGNALERIGFDTAYDAVEGFDKYVEGAASVICYTDAIQNLRALAQQVRYRTSDEGLRERVDDIRARDDLTEHQKELEIKEIMDKGQFSLSNFAVELDEYTNLLANKKSKYDRSMEHLGGRKLYNFMRAWQNRVAANMVAVNPASWLTNFGVITQAGAQLKTISVLKGMWQTLANIKTNDGLVEASDFLTNRAGSDPLVRTWQQSASAFLSTPMEWIDQFSAGTIVRARYMENVERGMSEETAMREADDFAANVMADRSKGAMPTLFEARNPLMKMFTQFQLEVNNTYSYLFKDLPREQRKKGVRYLALALFKFLIGGFLYNELYEYFIGRRPTLDPLGIINDTVGDLTGYELNNLVDTAAGGGLIKESEPEGVVGTIQNLAENIGQEAPFIGNLMGGGKLPFSSSMPNVKNILTALDSETATDKEKLAKVGKELVNPAAYWLMPFGGGQIKKMWQGISALKRQGSYTADGRLQYPIYSDRKGDKAGALARTLLFGKSATPEAQAWVEAGFGTLSAKATQTYEAMRAGGVDQRDSYELIKAMPKVKKTDTQTEEQLQIQLLNAFDIEDSGKVLYYYNMMASDKERAQIDNLLAEGADMGEYLRYLQEKSGVTGEKDADGKTISGSVKEETFALIDGLNLTPEQKTELAKEDYTPTGFEPWTENHDKLYKAVSTGKDLRSTLKGLEKDGYEPKEIRAAITGMFRDEYLTADRAGKARLKGYLRNAFMVTGLSQKEAENKIKKWEETQK